MYDLKNTRCAIMLILVRIHTYIYIYNTYLYYTNMRNCNFWDRLDFCQTFPSRHNGSAEVYGSKLTQCMSTMVEVEDRWVVGSCGHGSEL